MTKTRVEAVKAARVWCLAALLAFAGLAHAELVGPVVAIQDGDTIDVLVNRQPVRVRLAQIDAPEKRQAFGTRSRQALAELVFRQSVRVAETGRDRYGRVIGTVYLGSVDVNAQMVREGIRSRPGVVCRCDTPVDSSRLIAVGHRLAAERPLRSRAGGREHRQALSGQKNLIQPAWSFADTEIEKVHLLRASNRGEAIMESIAQ